MPENTGMEPNGWTPKYTHCRECGGELAGARHGWKDVSVTWGVSARVHTLCISRFTAHPLDEQKRRAA